MNLKNIFNIYPESWDKSLFFKEEFKGEKIVNYVRFFVTLALFFLAYTKAGLFSHLVFSKAVYLTTIMLILTLSYTIVLFIVFRLNIYHSAIKYISTTLDLTMITMSIYVYKFDAYPEYATIHFLARYGILFIFMSLILLRYSMRLAVYSGVLVGLEYLFLIVKNNYMTGLPFSFIGPDSKTYTSSFFETEGYLKVVYLVISGLVIGVLALNLKKLVISSIIKEQEKTNLTMKNKIIETAHNENKKYLDNIKEGLLLINKEFTIKGNYSKFLENIFEKNDFEGTNFIDLIYPGSRENDEKRILLKKFLNLMFKDTLVDDDMLKEVNPIINEKIYVKKPGGETVEKTITALFFKLINEGRIDEIMVIFEDRTDIINAEIDLETERIKRETELEYIMVILKAPEQYLYDFIEETFRVLDKFELNIDNLSDKNRLNEMFREMHSLKGLARSVEFKSISQEIHEIENVLSALRDKDIVLSYEIKKELRKKINDVFSEIDNIKSLQLKFKKFSNINFDEPKKRNEQSLNDFIESLKKMTEDISAELLKKIKFYSENKLTEDPPFLKDLKNPIIHLLRNAIDHGIEDRFERISNGKDETGKVILKLSKQDKEYKIEIFDDGEGINFNRIKKIAVNKGYVKENADVPNNKLLSLLFTPGFSTSKEVTDLSGRGVGLDVVKDTVNRLKGKISVQTEKNKGTKFIIKIPADNSID